MFAKMKSNRLPVLRHALTILFALALVNLFLAGCKERAVTQEPAAEGVVEADPIPADFLEFYDRFHADSAYQMEHINFPLEGLPSAEGDIDSIVDQRYFWQRDEWKKHNHFTDPSGQFEQWFEILDARVIEHWVQVRGTKLVIRRRFAKMDDGWYLIYYAGLRPLER